MSEFAESLVKQLEEHVTKLKKTHEESKQPITDDVPELRLFCLLLERILRFGQREKMTFFGDRKDYWNYLCDCLQGSRALDDSVQSVQRYTHLTTLQGKGRALIRESLVHGNLADMMQVATMAKQTADWYRPDAIMRDQQLSSMLISALYEMNDVAFHLSQAGQELNDNWPSFSKKAFHISNESTGYSTFVSDFDSIRPRDFNVDTSISSANTGNIAEPIVKRTRRKSKAGHVSIDTLEKYMKILEESIQIDSSQETNQDSGAQSDDIDGDDRDDQALPVSVKKLQKKLEGWSVSYESQLNELETELQHERDERVADQADAERLQQHLKDQLNDFRQAENQLKAKVESLASLLSAKSEELDTKQVQLDDLLMKSKLWEVKGIEWQARLDDTHDEMKSLQEDLSESRQKLNAVEADYAFLCSIKNNLDEKLEDTDKQLAEKDALVAELERNFKHSLEESEVTKRDLEEERELKTELESRLEAAETQISKLSNDYNRQESYGEVKGEQKDRDGSPLSDVTTEEGKQVVEQDSQLDYPNIHIKQSNSEEESLRKETVRLLEELNTARMEIEELKQANEDLTRKCTAAEEMVEQREAELAQKASTLHQVPFAMKSIRNSSRDVDKDESTNNLLLAEISEQKTVAVEDETMTDKQVAVSHKEVEVMRRTADEQVRQSGAADEERLQTAETMNTLTDEQQQIWSKVKHDVDTTDVLKDVQGEISNSSFEVEELKHRLNEEEQKRLLTEQECASLKYQMSTDVMQYKQQQDTVKELQREIAELQRMISESTKKLQDSKTEMMTLKGQRDSAHGDKEQIQVKVASVEQQLRQLQVEANSLEDQLFEVTSERDRNRREVLKLDEQLSHIQEQMSLTDKEQIRKMSDLKEKYEQMEEHVVNVAKQKSALWEENAQLRQDLALQLSRSWADEAIARQCNDCRTEFGLMTRKALSFGILFKKKESEDEGRELIPMKRVTSAKTDHSGELTAQRAGIYCLVFDNTTSSSSSRKVSYRVEVIKSS
ncbi:FYVE and coiled-coil domain-containing protein 1-like isoform X3 [Corticium candelabrum]|uniref:FYVE and coiled-coil domain-containing protein 1-like isoform X3 n=1 Tax=Corticium candelabrum TaxID=121492 RepID=UPI002E276FF2|nr:FYVE and coiled-coil domain-containing protein 1-like isoform X3 [Corticium candelabrum]